MQKPCLTQVTDNAMSDPQRRWVYEINSNTICFILRNIKITPDLRFLLLLFISRGRERGGGGTKCPQSGNGLIPENLPWFSRRSLTDWRSLTGVSNAIRCMLWFWQFSLVTSHVVSYQVPCSRTPCNVTVDLDWAVRNLLDTDSLSFSHTWYIYILWT